MLTFSAALIPPIAIVPMIALWMSITHKIEGGGWIPGTPLWKLLRLFAIAYVVTVIAHTLYGTLIVFLARKLGAKRLTAWIALYAAVSTLLVLRMADSDVGLQDGAIHILFSMVIALIAWPFVRSALTTK